MKTYCKNVFLTSFLALFLATILTACGSNQGANAIINVSSAHYLNPDVNGRPSPVVVTIYQLKTPFTFKQASYSALSSNSNRVLGNDLVDRTFFEMRPGSTKTVNLSIQPTVQYLGIVAAYRNINHANWHSVIKVNNEQGKQTAVNLILESQGIHSSVKHSSSGFGFGF